MSDTTAMCWTICSSCWFRYAEHYGHMIPCPVCAITTARADLGRAVEALKHTAVLDVVDGPNNAFMCPHCGARGGERVATAITEIVHRPDCEIALALSPSTLSAGEEVARVQAVIKTAQWIAKRTPRPPAAITHEVGVDIVNLVQKELCPIVDALSYPTSTTPGDST